MQREEMVRHQQVRPMAYWMKPRFTRVVMLVAWLSLFATAFWLRWRYVTTVPLFIDEYYSLWNSLRTWQSGLPRMLSGALETRGFLHSYLLVPFMGWEQADLLSRFSSLLLGLATVGVVWLVGRGAWNARVGWLATLAVSLLPEAIEAGGRVRFYAPLLLLALLTLYFAYQSIRYEQEGAARGKSRTHAPLLFALCFALALFALDQILLLYPFILLGMVGCCGLRFLVRPWLLVAHLLCVGALVARLALERWGQSGYTNVLAAQKSYFTMEWEVVEKWEVYGELLVEDGRLGVSLCVLLALGLALVALRRASIRRLPHRLFHQATLFFALQFGGVLLILLTIADWRETRYLWMVQPLWLLIAAAGVVALLEKVVQRPAQRWLGTLLLSGLVLALFGPPAWAISGVRPDGYAPAFAYVAEQVQPGDVVLSPQPQVCALTLGRPCDYYARQRGHEDFVVQRDGRWRDRWTNAPLVASETELQTALTAAPRAWFVADAHSLGERYHPEFMRVLVEQTSPVYESQGVRVLKMEGWVPPPAYVLTQQYDPPLALGALDLLRWERTEARPGQPLHLMLLWQLNRFSAEQLNTSLQLVSANGQRLMQTDGPPAKGILMTAEAGEAWLPDPNTLHLPSALPSGRYRVEAIVYDVATLAPVAAPEPLLWFRVGPSPLPPAHPLTIPWEDGVRLVGHDALPTTLVAGEPLTVRLVWTAAPRITGNYTGFVHLLGPDGALVSQSDALPENGFYPTSAWEEGELVAESHTLHLPDGLLAGSYTLLVGWYIAETGQRVARKSGADSTEIGRWTVRPPN